MSLPITVVTVAFGNSDGVRHWVDQWSALGASCLISDNGNLIDDDIRRRAKVLTFTGNTGFGSGINRAVRESDTELVLITNPDTLPVSRESLVTMMKSHSSGSLSGGATVGFSGKPVPSTGIWPTEKWVKSQIFKPAETLWREDKFDWLQGSLILVCRDDFLRIGGFSSNYPLFFEDVDLCARAVKSGMQIRCFPEMFIHGEGTGSDRVTATRLSCFHWGMYEFFRSHHPEKANCVRRMIMAKCILRMFINATVDSEKAVGYFRGFEAVFHRTPPGLPGVEHER